MEKSIFTPYAPLLSKKLKSLREAAGLTQRELATKLDVDQTIIVRLEKGQRRLDLIEFYQLCKVLKVDPVKVAADILRECMALDKTASAGRGSKRR